MKIRSFKVENRYRGITLKGVCQVIAPTTYMLTMEAPYPGLVKTEHFFAGYGSFDEDSIENIKSRAAFGLRMLYEQHLDIQLEYDSYKKLFNEWKQHEERLQHLKKQAILYKETAEKDTTALLDFYQEALIMEAHHLFEQFCNKYEIKPLSLSPSVLQTSIEIIEKNQPLNK